MRDRKSLDTRRRAPDLMGIGVQKCATGWLLNVLEAHPEIRMARSREGKKNIHFFDRYYDRGFEWYESHLPIDSDVVVGEYSTSYYYDSDAPERIRAYVPDVQLLVSLRNPVDRAYSQHKHQLVRGRLTGSNRQFETALGTNPTYVEQSRYCTHLSRWAEIFGKDHITVVLVEDIRARPEKVVERLYRAVGADPSYRPEGLDRRVHRSSGPGTRSILKRLLNPFESPSTFPPMEETTREHLNRVFEEENARLAELFDLDLSVWNQ